VSAQIVVYILCVIDLAALGVGLTVLRRVTRIVKETGDAVHAAVTDQIVEAQHSATDGFIEALGPALAMLPGALHDALGRVRISADGRFTIVGADTEQKVEPLKAVRGG